MTSKSNRLFSFFMFIGKYTIPIVLITLFVVNRKTADTIFFLIFMLLHCVERIWETFYTTREEKVEELQGDWTLAWATILYIVFYLIIIFEFNFSIDKLNPLVTSLGLVLYVFSAMIRWLGVRALGKQWAIHAIGMQKIKKVRLIKLGIYKYVRHPIYLGIIIEILSLAIISNAYKALLFGCLFNIPLQIIRMKLEEKNNVQKLGMEYKNYMDEVSSLLPFKYIKNLFE